MGNLFVGNMSFQTRESDLTALFKGFAAGAYVPTVFAGMYETPGLSMPSQHFVHAQDRSVISEIQPPTAAGARPVAQVLD